MINSRFTRHLFVNYIFLSQKNMNRILVSVVIPVYNCGQFIVNCVESVTRQTLREIEIIILDDCSTDDTLKNIPNDPRIRIIKNKKKKGSGILRNEGIELARGGYIAFLDGDDFYPDSNSLKKLMKIAESNNYDVVGGSLYILNSNTGEINYKFPGQFFEKEGLRKYVDYQHDGGFYRFIYRKEFLEKHKIRFPSYRRMQDPVFFVKAMTQSKVFYAITDYVYAYRKEHKKIAWNPILISEKINAISLILKISRDQNLSHLHYLMTKNFINFSNRHLSDLRNFKNQFQLFLLAFRNIDFSLLEEGWTQDKISFLRLKLFGVLLKSFLP